MTTLLHIDSSPMGEHSVTRSLSAKLITALKAREPSATVLRRDLDATPLPHIGQAHIAAYYTPVDQRTDEQKSLLKTSDAIVAEVMAADVIVVGAPMWNFGIPSVLKAWIDHVVRVGMTFQYSANGTGLIPSSKKVVIVSSRGGVYSVGPAAAMDHQESHLKTVLGFLGLTDVRFLRAEGVSKGAEAAQAAIAKAETELDSIAQSVL